MKNSLVIILTAFIFVLSVSADSRSGEAVTKSFCATCHMSGVANAPKTHDEEAWKARNKTIDELVASVKTGLNAMPPMGLCADCTDAEFKASIEFMMKKQ